MKAVILVLAAGALFAADEPAKKVKLPTGKNDLKAGEALFQGHCALCHGTNGGGGRGPALAQPKLKRAPDDAALVKTITDGIQGTEMPGAWQMDEREVRQVAAWVRSLGHQPIKAVPGDIAHGRELYSANGCANCHTIKRQGGTMGPNLGVIGLSRSASYLRDALLTPESAVPEDFLQTRVVLPDGTMITGVRLREDSFTIELRDYSGRLYSFWKKDVKEILKDRGKSPMPSYKDKLNETEITDLVAYLASLREDQ